MKCEHALLERTGVACWFCGTPRAVAEREIAARVGRPWAYTSIYRRIMMPKDNVAALLARLNAPRARP